MDFFFEQFSLVWRELQIWLWHIFTRLQQIVDERLKVLILDRVVRHVQSKASIELGREWHVLLVLVRDLRLHLCEAKLDLAGKSLVQLLHQI